MPVQKRTLKNAKEHLEQENITDIPNKLLFGVFLFFKTHADIFASLERIAFFKF